MITDYKPSVTIGFNEVSFVEISCDQRLTPKLDYEVNLYNDRIRYEVVSYQSLRKYYSYRTVL